MAAGDLAKLMRTKFPGQYDQLPDAELEALVLAKYPQYRTVVEEDTTRTPSPIPDPTSYESGTARVATALRDIAVPNVDPENVIQAIPAAGGAVGGVAGGLLGAPTVAGAVPGAVAGAALGGAAGESVRQGIQTLRGRLKPRPYTEELKDIGEEALIQGGTELAGGLAGKYVLKPLAKGVYRFATRPAPTELLTHPELIENALERGYIATPKSAAAARQAMTGSSELAEGMIKEAKATGAPPIPLPEITKPIVEEVAPIARAEAMGGEPEGLRILAKKIRDTREQFRIPRGGPSRVQPATPKPLFRDIDLEDSLAIKKRMDRLIDSALRGKEAGRVHPITTEANIATGRAHRMAQEARVPGLQDVNAETRRLIGITDLLERATLKGGDIGTQVAGGALTLGSVPALFAGHPEVAASALASGIAGRVATGAGPLTRGARRLYQAAPYQGQAYRAVLELLRQGINPEELGNISVQP